MLKPEPTEAREAPPSGELSLPQALQLAVTLQQENRTAEAEAVFLRLLEVAPDHADALHYYGVLKHFQQDTPAAIALIERALALAPDYVQAHNNLGNIYLRDRQYDKAEAAYRRVLELDPNFAVAYNNLGLVYKETGRLVEAIDTLLESIQMRPFLNAHYQNLGNVFRHKDEFDYALADYLAVLEKRPFNPETYRLLSQALYLYGDTEKAAQVLRKLLEFRPDDAMARHMFLAYSGQEAPDRASDGYLRQTFDRFADTFDYVLRQLEYKAPFLVENAVRELPSLPDSPRVLDAGCGTGLCGPLLRPLAAHLDGIDLSAKMLERAKAREVYDGLFEAELTAFLRQANAAYDVIVSADTLCYFGDLAGVFSAAAQALRPGGYFVFTLERLDSVEGFRLNAHGRYSHAQDYVEHCLAQAGLSLLRMQTADLRMELSAPVTGFVVAAIKPLEAIA